MASLSYIEHADTQVQNLHNNYHKNKAGERLICEVPLKVVFHKRDFGQGAYYAIKNGVPIAYCVGNVRQREGRRDRFVISSTFVDPHHRCQGVGIALYRAILSTGVVLVSDWDQSEGAVALWERLLREEPWKTVVRFGDGYFARRKQDAS